MTRSPRELVTAFWATANARQWELFATLLHAGLVYRVPQTREVARGAEGLVDVFRTWPGDWTVHVDVLVADDRRAFTAIRFEVNGTIEQGLSLFECAGGAITAVTDWWPEPYEPPARVSAWLKREDAPA